MIPIFQNRFGGEGNCHAACIASIFEVPLDKVPQPTREELDSLDGWEQYRQRINREFLGPRGFYESVLGPYTAEGKEHLPPGFAILCIQSQGVVGAHSVVCLDGEIVHDPNPRVVQGSHFPVEMIDWTVFQVLDPSRLVAKEHARV